MRVLLTITVLIASLISFGQAPPMKIGGPQGIETKRILTQDWMSIPVLSDTPVAPLTGAGWPGKGYIVFVAKTGNCVGGNDCPPKDTAVWEYTGQRWKRIGSDYLTKVVFGGNVQQSNTFSRQYTVSSYGAFINGYYYRNPAATAVTLDSKSSDSTSRIDVIVLTKSGVSVRKGDAKLIPYKPTIGSEEIELSTAYFNAYDTVSRFIPTSAVGVANIFRVPGRDSIYFTIDTVTVAIKDSVGITKNDTLAMLNPYKFTAANGITKDSTVFRIGGSLNQNTAINLSDRNLYISRILGDTAVRFSSDGKVLIGTTDSTEAHRFRVSGNSRIGFLQITNGGNATNTGQGIRIDGVDRSFVLQGSSGDNAVDMFRFTNWTSDTTTSPLTNNSKGVVRIYGGFRLPNTTNLSGNVLWITPRYNFTDTAHTTSTTVRGVYYNPTVASISGVRHIAYENTTGSNLLNSTSGNTRIGYSANDTTFKLDVNGDARVTRLLVNTTTVDTSAAANIVSTTKGFLQPRMTNTQRNAITNPATGLQLFSTTDSSNYLYRGTGGGWQKIANEITGSATLDFPITGHGTSSDLSFTVTGAEEGDVVSLGIPNIAMVANVSYTAWVSAANTVTIRLDHYASSGSVDPSSATFKVKVFK